MRVINLDEIGIKLINSQKEQVYLSKVDIKELLNKNYTIDNNVLKVKNKQLTITDEEIQQFDSIFTYISSHFGNK